MKIARILKRVALNKTFMVASVRIEDRNVANNYYLSYQMSSGFWKKSKSWTKKTMKNAVINTIFFSFHLSFLCFFHRGGKHVIETVMCAVYDGEWWRKKFKIFKKLYNFVWFGDKFGFSFNATKSLHNCEHSWHFSVMKNWYQWRVNLFQSECWESFFHLHLWWIIVWLFINTGYNKVE